jgi:hypothetical protein
MEFIRNSARNISRFDEIKGLDDCDIVMFSRSHTKKSVSVAQAAKAAGKIVTFDICDNLFHGYQSWHDRYRVQLVAEMIRQADIVTTPTRVLGEILRENVPDSNASYHVIPDALENLAPRQNSGPADIKLDPLRGFLEAHRDALHCVWFGSSTKNLAGFVDLDKAVLELAAFSRHQPVTLTIISDKRWRYWLSRRRWNVPTTYVDFNVDNFGAALALHRVAIIPVANNPYTAGKSINRPATALLAGLGVIADPLDSYEELRSFIEIGDWQAGLAHYNAPSPEHTARLAAARAYLHDRYAPEAIGSRWLRLIDDISKRETAR